MCFLHISDTFSGYTSTASWQNIVYQLCSTLRNNNNNKISTLVKKTIATSVLCELKQSFLSVKKEIFTVWEEWKVVSLMEKIDLAFKITAVRFILGFLQNAKATGGISAKSRFSPVFIYFIYKCDAPALSWTGTLLGMQMTRHRWWRRGAWPGTGLVPGLVRETRPAIELCHVEHPEPQVETGPLDRLNSSQKQNKGGTF